MITYISKLLGSVDGMLIMTNRYNSVVFSSLTVPAHYSIVSVDRRVERSPEALVPESSDIYSDVALLDMRRILEDAARPGVFENLTVSECINQYAISFLTSRGDVILVHETVEGRNETVEMQTTSFNGGHGEHFHWICPETASEPCRASLDIIRARPDDWRPSWETPGESLENGGRRVKYCLSRPIEDQRCRVNFNIFLAAAILCANLVKMVVLGHVAMSLSPDRLLVLGDAIQSFITRPDPFSEQSCLTSAHDIRNLSVPGRRQWQCAKTFTAVRKRVISSVGTRRVWIGVFL